MGSLRLGQDDGMNESFGIRLLTEGSEASMNKGAARGTEPKLKKQFQRKECSTGK